MVRLCPLALLGLLGATECECACSAEWMATCPSVPCTPNPHPPPPKEVMGWRARWSTPTADAGVGCMDQCAKQSWTNYINDSALTSVVICTGFNETQVACAAKARGARAIVVQSAWPKFNVSALENASYTKRWVSAGVKNLKNTTPWADGVQLDLEHFPRHDMEKEDLVEMVCEMQSQLKAEGMSLHSQDLAPWGSWGVFNVTALAHCLDYVVPMAYCSPASSTVAGPTDPLDQVQSQLKKGWAGIDPAKIIVGLPLFGYAFRCTNPRPAAFPTNHTCLIAQPPQFPQIQFSQALELFEKEETHEMNIQYDKAKASAWFEYTNRSDGSRYQVRHSLVTHSEQAQPHAEDWAETGLT